MSKKSPSLRKLLRKRDEVVARLDNLKSAAEVWQHDAFECQSELQECQAQRQKLDRRIRDACIAELSRHSVNGESVLPPAARERKEAARYRHIRATRYLGGPRVAAGEDYWLRIEAQLDAEIAARVD